MTSRELFEKWHTENDYFSNASTDDAFFIWQAAQQQAFEMAIDALKALHDKDGEWIYPHEKAIRALMENK